MMKYLSEIESLRPNRRQTAIPVVLLWCVKQFPRLASKTWSGLSAYVVILSAMPMVAFGQSELIQTKVGNPLWMPTDINIFSAPADEFDVFVQVGDALLGPDGEPFPPPYETRIADGMAAAGFQNGTTFVSSHIDGQPNGMYFSYVIVPDSGIIGSALDFEMGPIIPNSSFPIDSDIDLVREGVVVDSEFDLRYLGASNFDGLSHLTAFVATAAFFFPENTELPGQYEYRSSLRDGAGNGWNIVAPFQVVTEPIAQGDFDFSGSLDGNDIDLLNARLRKPDSNLSFDANLDGALNMQDQDYWVHVLSNTYFGDANLDGEFNSSDLTVVFQAAKFELDEDAGWSEGDWNGDSRFDMSDLTIAFQDGGYELGPQAAVRAVPEPSSSMLLAVGIMLVRYRVSR